MRRGEPLEARRHVRVELPDVLALELDDVHVDQRDVAADTATIMSRAAHADHLEVVREGAGGQRAVEREVLGVLDGRPVLVEQRAEDRVLVRKWW